MWGREFDPELKIMTFFELLSYMVDAGAFDPRKDGLKGLKVATYYGCMLAAMNAQPVQWEQVSRCCGTFLTVTRPDIANRTVEGIIDSAEKVKAECIVTACAMCHMNLEIRSKLPGKTPIFHFSELLSLSMGIGGGMGWFRRHLIDPRPLLRAKKLIG
jgi:heterodisulfide reductase subunit B2